MQKMGNKKPIKAIPNPNVSKNIIIQFKTFRDVIICGNLGIYMKVRDLYKRILNQNKLKISKSRKMHLGLR